MLTFITILIALALGYSAGIQHEKKNTAKILAEIESEEKKQ